MKAHQRVIREQAQLKANDSLFPVVPENISLASAQFKRIDYLTAKPIIEEHEWIGTMPLPKSCRFMFGVYFENILGGVTVFVEPSTRQFNAMNPRQVVQLNRGACVWWTPTNTASWLITKSCDYMKDEGIKAVIAYCTPEAGEIGTIYQACNFLYVGETIKSKAYFLDNHWVSARTMGDKTKWAKDKHPMWVKAFQDIPVRDQKPKHRYIKLIGNKNENRKFFKDYKYVAKPYPRRESSEVNAVSNTEARFDSLIPLHNKERN